MSVDVTEPRPHDTAAHPEPPPPVQMVQLLAGFQIAQALYVAAKLDVATALLDGPASVGDLAARTKAHPEMLGRLIRTLAGLGVFARPSRASTRSPRWARRWRAAPRDRSAIWP